MPPVESRELLGSILTMVEVGNNLDAYKEHFRFFFVMTEACNLDADLEVTLYNF